MDLGRRLELVVVRVRHMRQRVRRLNVVANKAHSAATLALPRNKNLRAPPLLFEDPEDGFD